MKSNKQTRFGVIINKYMVKKNINGFFNLLNIFIGIVDLFYRKFQFSMYRDGFKLGIFDFGNLITKYKMKCIVFGLCLPFFFRHLSF